MTKSTSVVPKAEQWGRVYDRGKKHFKGFCIQEEISRIKAVSYTHLDVYKRQEEGRRNRLHKVQPGKQQENVEIAYSKIKIFLRSVSEQSKNLPWINLKQKEGCDGNNRTDCDCHTVRILYALILSGSVVETLNWLTSLG